MNDRTIDLSTPDGPVPVYEAVPDDGGGAGVVVIQEAFGVNDHIADVTRRFAAEGYHALAPHLFHRAPAYEAGTRTAPYGDFSKVIPLFEGLTDDGILADVDAALDHHAAASIEAGRVGIVGFCFGGRATFLVALERTLGAAVGFYGGGIVTQRFPQYPSLVDRAPSLRTPWLGLFGDRDESITIEEVERLRDELAGAGTPAEVVRYADAEHGFHSDQRPSYHEPSARDAWARTLEWLRRLVGP